MKINMLLILFVSLLVGVGITYISGLPGMRCQGENITHGGVPLLWVSCNELGAQRVGHSPMNYSYIVFLIDFALWFVVILVMLYSINRKIKE